MALLLRNVVLIVMTTHSCAKTLTKLMALKMKIMVIFVLRDKERHEQHKIYWLAAEAVCCWWTTVQLQQ
jgi:hypothetical protein